MGPGLPEGAETVRKDTEKPSFFVRLATVIVDKRKLIFFLYACALLFCLFSRNWVSVCNDITEYLPDSTETRQGLTLMEEEFTTFGTARVMVSHVTRGIAEDLAEQIGEIEGVSSASLGDSIGAEEDGEAETPEDIASYFKGADALISVTFAGEEDDESALAAMEAIRELLAPYDFYIDSSVGDSQADSLADEMGIILAVAAVIIVLVLLLTSRSYAEIPVLLLTFIAAALLNLGTNFIFGEISFVSNSVTVVLQLALAIDYAIIMLHRFLEEREHAGDREACIAAVSAAIPSISASSLTTISGLAAMMFMQFRIGYDMGIILAKSIIFSMVAVFFLMPGLLLTFSKAIDNTHHKSFVPKITAVGKFCVATRYIIPPILIVGVIIAFFLSNKANYVYDTNTLESSTMSDNKFSVSMVNKEFGMVNQLAVIVPNGDYEKEAQTLKALEKLDVVKSCQGLGNIEAMDGYMLTDKLNPRQFAELIDLDIEVADMLYSAYALDQSDYGALVSGVSEYEVPFIDMFLFIYDQKESGNITLDDDLEETLTDAYSQICIAKDQLLGEDNSRFVLELNVPYEGEETTAALDQIRNTVAKFYNIDDILLVGNATSDKDLGDSFATDNTIITVLTALFVMIILLFTFQSAGLPVLLVVTIQGSIWMNFSLPYLLNENVYFLGYLVVSAIQMGATIDYAIVITSRYMDLKTYMPIKEAAIEALNQAFPTIVTSGSMLVSAGFIISYVSSNAAVAAIGLALGRGTLTSILLVLLALPQTLLIGDIIIQKTAFTLKRDLAKPLPSAGRIRMNGHIKGYVNGVLEGDFIGVIDGEMGAVVRPKDTVTMEERDDAPEENYPRLEAQELPEDETAGQKATGADTEAADKKASDKEKTAESEGTEDEQ